MKKLGRIPLLTSSEKKNKITAKKIREKAMNHIKISLVIPAYNEGAIIKDTVEQALAFLEARYSDFELIISDDGSTDKTRAIVGKIEHARLRCVSHKPRRGKGSAVRDGILAATGDLVVYTDADLAYGLDAVGEIVSMLEETRADLAIGSRRLHPEGYADYPFIRLVASRTFGLITGLIAGFHYDTQCGIKAFTADSALKIFTRCETDGFAFDFEAMLLAKYFRLRVAQLPVTIINHRESKVNVLKDSIRMFSDIIKIRRDLRKRLKREGEPRA